MACAILPRLEARKLIGDDDEEEECRDEDERRLLLRRIPSPAWYEFLRTAGEPFSGESDLIMIDGFSRCND